MFTMVFTVLFGLGSGYFLWGSRVARLTESLSGLTLEYDTMRAELASRPPRPSDAAPGAASPVTESLTAIQSELAAQKVILDQQNQALTTLVQGAQAKAGGSCEAAAKELRVQLDRCIADMKDLQGGGVAPAPRYPSAQPQEVIPADPPQVPDPRYDRNQY